MTDNAPLNGLSVLVTRPARQADGLVAAIEAGGGHAQRFPLLEIDPVTDAASEAVISACIQNLDQYDLALFISSNAARFGMAWIDRFWPQLPAGITVIAVGPATAESLAELPCEVVTAPGGMQSEDLLRLPLLQQVKGKKIALFRGVGGRELLAESLRERGARVDCIETYQRRLPEVNRDALRTVLRSGTLNSIVVTSGEILDSLCRLVDIRADGIEQIPLLVPSKRVAEMAQNAGFKRVFCCNGATDQAIVKTLAEVAGQILNPNQDFSRPD